MKVTVLGAGAWGTAIATVLAYNEHEVSLWCRELEVVDAIKTTRINKQFLPDVSLNKLVVPTNSLEEALSESAWIFAAVPVKFFREVLVQAKPYIVQESRWVILNKGIEQKTLLVPSQILEQVAPVALTKLALVGPSFAFDLAHKQVTGVLAAGDDMSFVSELQSLLHTPYFTTDSSDDIYGAQLCSALKNVVALGVGMLDGAGYTDNTKALFLVKSLAQAKKLVVACGGKAETVDGLAGLGDLILTALGRHSRNVAAGRRLARGSSVETITSSTSSVAEGITTAASLHQFILQKKLSLPLLSGVHEVIEKDLTLDIFIKRLF